MPNTLYSEPVGILVGTIMKGSRPMMIWIHRCPDGNHHTRIYHESDPYADAFGSAISLAASLSPQVKRFWSSAGQPGWYYIQLDDDYPPQRLIEWKLPWSVYESWTRWGRK